MEESSANWESGVEHAALSDVGLRRANNQDSLAVSLATSESGWQKRGHLFVVADGMGAHAAGELASKMATDVVPLSYQKLLDLPPHEALEAAILDANTQINNRGQASEDFHGMGTTVNALVLGPNGAFTGHVGDSRIYRFRGNRLEQLTFDHSLVWEMREAGNFPPGEEPSFIPKNVITRSLGPNPEVMVDLEGPYPIEPGDTFLLCSDGLTGPVEDAEIGKILGCLDPEEAARTLVDLANLRGGPDNITAIVVRAAGAPVVEASAGSAQGTASNEITRLDLLCILVFVLLGSVAIFLNLLGLPAYLPVGVVACVAFMIFVIRLVVRKDGEATPSHKEKAPSLGGGPYTSCECVPDSEFGECLLDLARQLREAASREDWAVDWDRFNQHHDQAATAIEAGDHGEAVREFSHAIRFMMGQLRNQARRPPSDRGDDSVL